MSALVERPRVTDLAVMMREIEMALRDGEWQRSPVGRDVGRYLRALRWSSSSANTHLAYEHVLALLALRHADWPSLADFCAPGGTEYLREFLDAQWGGASVATKRQRAAIVRSFFRWAASERRIPYDPSATIRSPRGRGRAARQAYPLPVLRQLVAAQGSLRDQCCLGLLCQLGLRKDELRRVQMRDVDLVRSLVLVHGKGGKDELLPLVGSVRDDLYLHVQVLDPHPDEYLIYPRQERRSPLDPSSLHRWFKRCLARADLPTTITMHELRHSAADALYRSTGNVMLARMLLRHEHLATTEAYLHPLGSDLREALHDLDAIWQESK